MNYNQTTLESLKGTWIGDLLSLTSEEIQKAADDLPEINQASSTETEPEEGQEGPQIKLPLLLGEMNDYEKALNALFDKKYVEHKEICGKEKPEDFSPEHERLHELISLLKNEMWSSIQGRYPDSPGTGLQISKGGKIFAIKQRKHPMEEALEMFAGKGGMFGGVEVHVVRM